MKRAIVAVGVILLSACTGIQQYRCGYPGSPFRESALLAKCGPAVEKTEDYSLGFVEFDDVGAYWDRKQSDFVLMALESELKKSPHIVVVFVHGWNHNAALKDPNVVCFRQVLRYLSQLERDRAASRSTPPYKVAGVYVGWRGASYNQSVPGSILYNWTSFWGRKGAAHAVGASGGVTEVLARVEEGIKNSGQPSLLVTAGHSFGGAVAYDAVSHILIARDVEAGGTGVPRFGNLVVLVNPAFEATMFEVLHGLSDATGQGDIKTTAPALAIFTSKKDKATRFLFPAGRFLASFWLRHRPSRNAERREVDTEGSGQGLRARTAVGHYPEYWTHRLLPAARPRSGPSKEPDNENPRDEFGCKCKYPMPTIPGPRASEVRCEEGEPIGSACLATLVPVKNRAPVFVVTVEGAIIPDHNSIYGADFVSALAQLVMKSVDELQ
jgi:hypothetical protein